MNERKKIEPTDTMVEAGASSAWEEVNPGILGWNSISERHKEGCRRDARAVLTAALNHPDAAALLEGEDDRPWEPLNGGRVYVGDEVRQDRYGVTTTAVVGRVDDDGDPWATEDGFIGQLGLGTWYVRRPIQELPTKPDAVIERADGHKYITATVSGETYRAREAMLSGERWHAVWRRDSGREAISFVRSHEITPGTWKVDDR